MFNTIADKKIVVLGFAFKPVIQGRHWLLTCVNGYLMIKRVSKMWLWFGMHMRWV